MGDRNHIALGRPLEAEDDITVVFYKVDSRGGGDNNSSGRGGDHDDDELPAERIRLHGSSGMPRRSSDDEEKAEEEEEEDGDARRTDTGHGDGHLPEDGERKRLFCQPASCVSNEPPSSEDGAGIGARARQRLELSSFLRRAKPPFICHTKATYVTNQKWQQAFRASSSVKTTLYNRLSRRVSVDNVGGITCTPQAY